MLPASSSFPVCCKGTEEKPRRKSGRIAQERESIQVAFKPLQYPSLIIMQGLGSSQLLFLVVVGCSSWVMGAWTTGPARDSELFRPLVYYAPNSRHDMTSELDRRPLEDSPASYEDLGGGPPSPVAHFYNELDKRGQGKLYTFGLGKRTKNYGFGLGKRLEDGWKTMGSASFTPGYRQERRSKIYSFGLGKRGGDDIYEEAEPQTKKSRQFGFGLGKREVEPWNRAVETPP